MNFKYKIQLKFVPKGPSTNIPGLFQIMAWRRPGDKPLSETVMVSLLMHVCVTRPQWVNKDLSMVIACPIAKVVSSIYRHSKDYVALVSDTGVASAYDTFSLFIFVRDEKEIWFFWLISVHKKLHFIKRKQWCIDPDILLRFGNTSDDICETGKYLYHKSQYNYGRSEWNSTAGSLVKKFISLLTGKVSLRLLTS